MIDLEKTLLSGAKSFDHGDAIAGLLAAVTVITSTMARRRGEPVQIYINALRRAARRLETKKYPADHYWPLDSIADALEIGEDG